MAQEIERTFLVTDDSWRSDARDPTDFRQGYFETDDEVTVRVRTERPLDGDDARATLCIKGRPDGLTRPEFEYGIPVDDAVEMLEIFCRGRTVEKTRFYVDDGAHLWEIDAFAGALDGLVVAEVELEAETESVNRPSWAGSEVTGDPAYINEVLAREGRPGDSVSQSTGP